MSNIEVKINAASLETLISFYNENDAIFIPPLSSQVNSIEEYARKLKNNAVIFEAWDNKELIGLVAGYFNNYENKTGFITSVVVSIKYQNKGIAKTIMKKAFDYARDKGFELIQLEVHKENINAVALYEKFGFAEKVNDLILMELYLNNIE